MTTPTATFDPRTAKVRAAEIIDNEECTYEEDGMGPLDALHTQIFDSLGTTVEEITATLAGYGVKGTRPDVADEEPEEDGTVYGDLCDTENSALAVFLREVCGASSADLGVDGGLIYWENADRSDEIGHESVMLPAVLIKFQQSYQDFGTPQLYKDPEPAPAGDAQA